MKFDTCSADDVVEVLESVMDGGERTEIVLSIDTGDLKIETRLTDKQALAIAARLSGLALGPTPHEKPRCPNRIAGALPGKYFQCERDRGHSDRCKAGGVFWQE